MIMMNAASTLPTPPPPTAAAPTGAPGAAPPHSSPLSPPPPPLHHPPPPPPPPSAEAAAKARMQEREALRHVIAQWNANRLDLFELSEPNEELEFHGVMRFYFQDSGQKVATKCIRVASSAPATAVVETLIEKFRPDMRMLSVPEYALYEIHENGDERRLAEDEKPLLVQLNWHKDDREGRFLLRRIDDKTNVPAVSFQEGGSSFRRKLSKREKKQLKKQEKLNKMKGAVGSGAGGGSGPSAGSIENDGGVAEKLYTELPETSFTRSISNPEAVMRRRRQQKLERKLQQFRSKDGGPDTGGTLKIYGESLCRDVPYKTLLLSVRDTAAVVVREMLSKYGLTRVDPSQYCLIQVNVLGPDNGGESSKEYHGSTNREYILDDDECPLAILMNHPSSRGSIMFHVRRRPADYHPRKRKKKPQQGQGQKGGGKGGGEMGPGGSSSDLLEYRRYDDSYDRLPFLLELNPDGSDIVNGIPRRHRLQLNVTEVGSERSSQGVGPGGIGGGSQSLQLFGPHVQPRHCVVAHTEGIVTVTPCSRDAETSVNGQRIYETTILQNGAVVKFGRIHSFRFLDPSYEDRMSRQRHDSSRQGHDYSDRQSNKDESILHGGGGGGGSVGGVSGSQGNFETTFDVDGHVETVSSASSSKLQQQQDPDSRSQRSVGSREGNRSSSNYERYPPMQTQPQPMQRPPTGAGGGDPILPAALEFREEATDTLLDALITSLDPSAAPPHFRLAPTYALYLAARFRASTHYRPELTPTERAHRLTALLARVAAMIRTVVQERYGDAESLAFWMANASELLHFLKSDRHICAFSLDAQDILAEAVQIAFRNLVSCLQADLGAVMPHFLADNDDDRNGEESAGSVLQVLASAMALLRRCRVNAALTIQLFSQLFHYVNVWAFNRVVASAVASGSANSPTSPHPHTTHHHHPHPMHPHHHLRPSYCSREWGLRLGARLARVEAWAERQGLELAADCHLSRIAQAAHLLQAPKYNAEDLRGISTACFKLNSLQLRALLENYQHAPDEPRIPMDLVENVVRVAENVCDDLVRNEGREVRLEEEEGELLRLQFLLPDDGYSCDVVRGLPPGLLDLLAPLQRANICCIVPQHTSAGFWTVYMTPPPSALLQHPMSPEGQPHPQTPNLTSHGPRSPSALSNRSGGMESSSSRLHGSMVGHLQGPMASPQQQHLEPETQVIKLHKSNNGMGLSIVAAKGAGQERLGIYIKSVVKGGAADADGRLQAGDQLLKVDGQSLVGITQEKAAEYLVRTGPVVTLEVAKQGAIYHGLATLLSQPSPVMTRVHRPYSLHQEWAGARGWTGGQHRSGARPVGHIPPSASLPQLRPPLPAYPLQHSAKPMAGGGRTPPAALPSRDPWGRIPASASAHSLSGAPRLLVFSPTTPLLVISQACVPDDTLPLSTEAGDAEGPSAVEIYGGTGAEEDVPPAPPPPPPAAPRGDREICSRCHCRSSSSSGYPGDADGSSRKRATTTADCGTNTEEEDFLDDYEEEEDNILCAWPDADCWGGREETGGCHSERSKFPSIQEGEEDCSWKVTQTTRDSSRKASLLIGGVFEDGDLASETGDSVSSDDTDLLTSAGDAIGRLGREEDEWYKSDGNLSKSFESGSKALGGGEDVLKSWSEGDITADDLAEAPGLLGRPSWLGTGLSAAESGSASRSFKSWRSPREVRMGSGRVAALARHFASLGDGGDPCGGGMGGGSGCWNPSLSKSMPDISQIERKLDEEEEEHGECGWKRSAAMSCWKKDVMDEDDVADEIGYRLLCTTLSSYRKGKALRFLSGPLGSRPRSEDNLVTLTWGMKEPRTAGTLETPMPAKRTRLPHHLSLEYHKPEGIRPRRMSERDLPSKVQGEHNHSMGERMGGRMAGLPPPHMPAMHGSKSVPSLNSGHGDVGAMTIGSPQQTTVGGASPPGPGGMRQHPSHSMMQQQPPPQQQHQQGQPQQQPPPQAIHMHSHHEVYNPGYSRTSSTNSIPQKSSSYDGLRSRSSQNLNEPRSPGASLPPQGLGTRQASNPGLAGTNQQQPHPQHHQYSPPQQQHQQQGPGMPQQHPGNPSQQGGAEAERFYQNLSIYRSQQPEPQGHNGFAPPSPNRGKLPNSQGPIDERGSQVSAKPALRGSQSSLHRQVDIGNGNQGGANGARDRPVSAYIPQNGPQPVQQTVPRSQSARDFMRQEAKLQEMQEEVRRRREGGRPLVGPSPSLASPTHHQQQQYNAMQQGHPHSRSHPQLPQQRVPNTTYSQNSGYQEGVQQSPGHHHHHPNPVQSPVGGYPPYQNPHSVPGNHPQFSLAPPGQQHQFPPQQQPGLRNPPPTAPKPRPTMTAPGLASGPQRQSEDVAPLRPPPPEDLYRDSPPPPPPPTSTHPLYQQSGAVSPGQKPLVAGPNQQNEGRYNASAGDPPRGSFYPTNNSSQGGLRQFPFAATNPWDREEKEKEQARRREAARLWRDRQIAELEALGPGGRGPGQEERLRALRLEREFQRRAEEEEARRGKRGGGEDDDDDDEEEEEEGEDEEGEGEVGGGGGEGEVGGGGGKGGGEGKQRPPQRHHHHHRQDGSGSGVEHHTTVLGNGNNQGEEHNGNIEETRDSRPGGGLLRMVASPEEQDYHPSRRPVTSELPNGPIRSPQVHTHQQVSGNQMHQPQGSGPAPLGVARPPQQQQQPGPLRLDNLVVNGGVGGQSPSTSSPRHNGHHGGLHGYQDGPSSAGGPYSPQSGFQSGMGSGSQRLDSLLSLGPTSPTSTSAMSGGLSPGAPAPPERGSSFAVMSQQQVHASSSSGGGVLRNANGGGNMSQSGSSVMSSSASVTPTTTTTTKRVSFHDSKVVTFDDNANHQERSTVREDPNNFINEAQTLLATPRSPDGSFTGNTPGVIGAQEVYRDPRTKRLAEQQKLLVNRTGPLPEKLSFKEKMKMFAMETGEDGTPKDKVKISRAQRDIEGPVPPNGYSPN